MLRRIGLLAAAATTILSIILCCPSMAMAQGPPPFPYTVTHLRITNGTSSTVYMGVELQQGGLENGCTSNVTQLYMNCLDVGTGKPPSTFPNPWYNPLHSYSSPVQLWGSGPNGYFALHSKYTYELYSTMQDPVTGNYENCLQTLKFSFNQFPQCPTTPTSTLTPQAFPPGSVFSPGPSVPNGVTEAECNLNLPGAGGPGSPPTHEAADISCVQGSNAIVQLRITSPSSGANSWTYDTGGTSAGTIGPGQSFHTQNSWVLISGTDGKGCDDNCVNPATGADRIGVYPYGCSQCNENPDVNINTSCQQYGITGQFCDAKNGIPTQNSGCNFDRSPNTSNPITQQFGGTVQFIYVGPAHPPSKCP